MKGSAALVQGRWVAVSVYLGSESSWLQRKAVASAYTMLHLLSRLDFCFSQAKQET